MKYFTPERYLRLGNLNDEPAFLAAQEDWERAVEGYKNHLGRIRERLPDGLGRLVASVYMHDAQVLDMWQGRRSRFTITLQPESDPSRLVVLVYSLLEPPRFNYAALPAEVRSEPVAWLYDELDTQQTESQRIGRPATFTQEILLSNGWEVRLRFRTVSVTRPVALLPAAPNERPSSVPAARSA